MKYRDVIRVATTYPTLRFLISSMFGRRTGKGRPATYTGVLRHQLTICEVFQLLVARGPLHSRCLAVPIDTDTKSAVPRVVSSLFFCFSFPSQDDDLSVDTLAVRVLI